MAPAGSEKKKVVTKKKNPKDMKKMENPGLSVIYEIYGIHYLL